MTIKELLDMDAEIEITFHNIDENFKSTSQKEALKKIECFKTLGRVKNIHGDGTSWLSIGNDVIEVISFYERDDKE